MVVCSVIRLSKRLLAKGMVDVMPIKERTSRALMTSHDSHAGTLRSADWFERVDYFVKISQ